MSVSAGVWSRTSPTVAVAASFQKDPQVLIAHPDVNGFDDLKSRTLFISKEGMTTFFQWLKADYGFDEIDAYMLLSQAGRIRLGNMVDPKYTMGASILKTYLTA